MNVLILGTGNIASMMAKTILKLNHKEIVLYGVASRNKDKAEEFKNKYNVKHAFSSYQEAIACKEVDLVYIATPHIAHYQNAKECLLNHKATLCEKPFTINKKQLEELIVLAKENNTLLVEAFWTRFMPFVKILDDLLKQNIIGNIEHLKATFGFDLRRVQRLVDLKLGGGALLDLGVYSLNMALLILGEDFEISKAECKFYKTGVDAQDNIVLKYKNGAKAKLISGLNRFYFNNCIVYGEKGKIIIKNINNPTKIKVKLHHQLFAKNYPLPSNITGYEYELLSCLEALKNNKLECEEISHQTSLKIMDTLDKIRKSWNLKYPNE